MSFSSDDFIDIDIKPHRWSNYCLYCHAEGFEPAALYGLRLWHYCAACVLICTQCEQEKPIYAFPYNGESAEFQAWKRAQDAGGAAIELWKVSTGKPREAMARADKTAHQAVCSHCQGWALDQEERKKRDKLALDRIEAARKQKEMLSSPAAQAALDAILKGLS